MVSVVSFKEHQISRKISSTRSPLQTLPLGKHHAEQMAEIFKSRNSKNGWCGYAIVDHIPHPYEEIITSSRGRVRLGAVLFINASDETLLLVRDMKKNFCLISMKGRIIRCAPQLEKLLKSDLSNLLH